MVRRRHREHPLEAADAGAVRIDPDHLGRPDLPERRRSAARYRRQSRACISGASIASRARSSGRGRSAAATACSGSRTRSSPSPVTDGTGVWVLTGTGVLKALRLQRQGALGARHPGGLRPLRAELGLRLVAAAARRLALRPGAARHADRRSVVPAPHRQDHGQDDMARRAADERQSRSRPIRTPRRRSSRSATPRSSSSPAATPSPAMTSRPARSCGGSTA